MSKHRHGSTRHCPPLTACSRSSSVPYHHHPPVGHPPPPRTRTHIHITTGNAATRASWPSYPSLPTCHHIVFPVIPLPYLPCLARHRQAHTCYHTHTQCLYRFVPCCRPPPPLPCPDLDLGAHAPHLSSNTLRQSHFLPFPIPRRTRRAPPRSPTPFPPAYPSRHARHLACLATIPGLNNTCLCARVCACSSCADWRWCPRRWASSRP